MATPKLPPPKPYEFNESDRAAFRGRFWRCPVRLVEEGVWRRMWAGTGRRGRGGGAAGALLPVLAVHVWPEQENAVPGWTGTATLSYRRLARLSGLDKDTVATALKDLKAAGLVTVELRPFDEQDVRVVPFVRVAAVAYPAGREAHVAFPAEFVYGGGWSRLPGVAARHLCLAWAAWAAGRVVDPAGGPLPRTRAQLLDELVDVSGMGRTAVRSAVATLAMWGTEAGDQLVLGAGGFLRPDLAGIAARNEWSIAEPDVGATADRPKVARAAPANEHGPADADASAGDAVLSRACGGAVGGSRLHAGRPALQAAPERAAPPAEASRPASMEGLKLWWVARYLEPWANRMLRRRWKPVRQAVFVDLCPGVCKDQLPAALQAALTIAKRLRRFGTPTHVPLRILVVQPDPRAAHAIRELRPPFDPLLEVVSSRSEALMRRLGPRTEVAALIFVGSAYVEGAGAAALGEALGGDDREVIAVSIGSGRQIMPRRLWRTVAACDGVEDDAAVLARTGLQAGAAAAFVLPIAYPDGALAGTVIHLAKSTGGLLAFKGAVEKPRLAVVAEDGCCPAPFPVSGLVEALARRYAGRTMNWTEAARPWRSLRFAVLSDTAALPLDLKSLRRELSARGWKEPGRRVVFRFPVPHSST